MSSIVKVDTIQENTSANGITVDGLNIKDSKLTTSNSVVAANITADAVDATKIADDAISEEHLDVTAITGHSAETSVATDDLILISDTSASGALKKKTRANFVSGIGGTNTPAFYLTKTSNQSISTNTHTIIQLNSAVIDTDSGFDSSNYRWTVPSGEGGTYFVTWRYIFSGTWDARIIAYLNVNGSDVRGMQSHHGRVDGGVAITTIIALSAGDHLKGAVYQDNGSTRDIVGATTWCELAGFKLI